ncbi:MAG: tetratricopeptide repeat protein [Pseudomonadota bacterium]
MPRAQVGQLLQARGAREVKDLTRTSDLLAVGSGATNLIASGALGRRLSEASSRQIPIYGEARLLEMLEGRDETDATLDTAPLKAEPDLLGFLAAFDLIHMDGGKIRFSDADMIRGAQQLRDSGTDLVTLIQALQQRRQAPKGRHRLSLAADGTPVLQWEDGVTTMTGQGLLPLTEGEDLDLAFEAALEAEESDDLREAVRLYDLCTRHDRTDPIAPFNLGNVLMQMEDHAGAKLAFQRALARRPKFPEAHYNLAICLEKTGDPPGATDHLKQALDQDPDYAEAMFNLAQLELAQDRPEAALSLFRRFLGHSSSDHLIHQARKAITLIERTVPGRHRPGTKG